MTVAWKTANLLRKSGVERVKGIEPSSQAWEAHILPLNHTRKNLLPRIDQCLGGTIRPDRPNTDMLGHSCATSGAIGWQRKAVCIVGIELNEICTV